MRIETHVTKNYSLTEFMMGTSIIDLPNTTFLDT